MASISRRNLVYGAAGLGLGALTGLTAAPQAEADSYRTNGRTIKTPVLEFWRLNRSRLGQPTSNVYKVAGGLKQRFQRGDVYYSATTSVVAIAGAIKVAYDAQRGSIALGIPTSAEVELGNLGATQKTERARLFSGAGGVVTSRDVETIRMPHVSNFRDAAGESGDVAISGGLMRRGVLYRSGRLGVMQDFDELVFRSLGIQSIIELRQSGAARSRPDPSIPGVTTVNAGVSADTNYSKYVTDGARRRQWAKALRYIAASTDPVIVHCHSGKDRTGWLVAQLHYLLGASDRTVLKEFLKSNDYIGEVGVRASQLATAVSRAKRDYGSMPRYFTRGLGLTTSDINRLRQRFAS